MLCLTLFKLLLWFSLLLSSSEFVKCHMTEIRLLKYITVIVNIKNFALPCWVLMTMTLFTVIINRYLCLSQRKRLRKDHAQFLTTLAIVTHIMQEQLFPIHLSGISEGISIHARLSQMTNINISCVQVITAVMVTSLGITHSLWLADCCSTPLPCYKQQKVFVDSYTLTSLWLKLTFEVRIGQAGRIVYRHSLCRNLEVFV